MTTHPIPELGFGTSGLEAGRCTDAVVTALNTGYRLVDTAEMYENQDAVGTALQRATVDRDEVFVATKINSPNLAYQDVLDHADQCREKLGVETIDLLYVHWPIRAYDPEATLAAFDELYDRGTIRNVGLSNFTPALLEAALDLLDAPVFAHQVECHPLFPQTELRQYAREFDHSLVAYSPLAQGEVTDIPVLNEIAADYDATPAQVALAWLLSKETVVPIPMSSSRAHIEENFAARELSLDRDAIERIDAIDRRERQVDFPEAPWN